MNVASSRRPRNLLDRVTDAFLAVDEQWRVTDCTAPAERLFDRPVDELEGRTLWELLPHSTASRLRLDLERAMDGDRRVVRRDRLGATGPEIDVRATPVAGGLDLSLREVPGPRSSRRDPIERSTILEAIRDGVVAFDGDGRVTTVNQAVEGLFGADRSDLVGVRVDGLPAVTTLEADSGTTLREAIAAIQRDADERRVRIRCEAAGGVRIGEMRVVPHPIADHGGAVGIVREVTEREEHERIVTELHAVTRRLFGVDFREEICAVAVEAAANLLELELSGVWLLDEEHNRLEPIAATPRTYDEIGGLPQFSAGEGLVWDAFRQGDPRRYDDLWNVEGVYNPDTPIRSELIVPIGSHGVLMAGELEPHRFDETDRELAATLAANTEAALDRADREQLLRARTDELERQGNRLETIAAVLSRDINDRLASARTALDADDDGTARDALETAERLVEDVREVAGTATGSRPRSRISLIAAAREAATAVPAVTLDPAAAESATLRARRRRFVRFLEALFRYARSRTDGPVTARIGLLDARSGFYVEDDGAPIPPEDRPHVFEPERAAGDELPGLGPALAREIALANNWELTLATPNGDGARFEIAGMTTLSTPTDE